MIQTQQEDREWKQQVHGLQNKLQTFTKQREALRQQVETLQQYLFLLRHKLMMCHACRYEWETFKKGGNSNSRAQRKRLFHLSTPNTTSAFYGAKLIQLQMFNSKCMQKKLAMCYGGCS